MLRLQEEWGGRQIWFRQVHPAGPREARRKGRKRRRGRGNDPRKKKAVGLTDLKPRTKHKTAPTKFRVGNAKRGKKKRKQRTDASTAEE